MSSRLSFLFFFFPFYVFFHSLVTSQQPVHFSCELLILHFGEKRPQELVSVRGGWSIDTGSPTELQDSEAHGETHIHRGSPSPRLPAFVVLWSCRHSSVQHKWGDCIPVSGTWTRHSPCCSPPLQSLFASPLNIKGWNKHLLHDFCILFKQTLLPPGPQCGCLLHACQHSAVTLFRPPLPCMLSWREHF